jgi:hypothetical protein
MLTAVEPAARHLVETRYPCSASTPVSTKPVHRRLSEPQSRHPTDNQPPMNPGAPCTPPTHPNTPAEKHARSETLPMYDPACARMFG